MKSFLLAFLLIAAPACLLAQVIPVSSINLSGTITATGTFQPIQGQTNNRQGCAIQNPSTHNMSVYFGPMANATTATAVTLQPGQSVYCTAQGNIVLKDQVSITGTSGDAFYANFQ